MLNKLVSFIRRYEMISPGDTVVCAVSGGADSVALLFAMYLLKEKLQICLCAAHFDHQLRGEESDGDAEFVRELCDRFDIPLTVGSGPVVAGQKGLESAARDARYAFLMGLEGKIATAHTADDNAETVLMRLVRGTGLKGLGAIAPVRGRIIRPMLTVTRREVMAFLDGYCLPHREDSSNATDRFLRNRLRHHVMPLLVEENPRLAENLSEMALRLREDERQLTAQARVEGPLTVSALRAMPEAHRSRVLDGFLKDHGFREPEAAHLAMVEAVIASQKPSARAELPGGLVVRRCYDLLVAEAGSAPLEQTPLSCPGTTLLPGWRIECEVADHVENGEDVFTVDIEGPLMVRARQSGDEIRLHGGTKTLKKLFIDRKIPAHLRDTIPVLADGEGILGVYGIGPDVGRIGASWKIRIIKTES